MGHHNSKCPRLVAVDKAVRQSGAIPVAGRYITSRDISADFNITSTELGTGVSGAVLLARGKHDGVSYAVKSYNKRGLKKDDLDFLKSEIEVYLSLDHPHIARLERVYETDSKVHLVMEYCAGGELFDRVVGSKGLSEDRAAHAMQQMLLAVSYLHSHNVVHRDLKLENFLYEDSHSDYLKLIDFGFAKEWDGQSKMSDRIGTVDYVAPEVLSGRYTEKADEWSLGVIAFMLLTGQCAFAGRSQSHKVLNIRAGRMRESARFCQLSDDAKHFVRSLLTLDPTKRSSANEALNHPWIQAHCQATAVVDCSTLAKLRRFSQQSSSKRACLSMTAWSLPWQNQATTREMFDAMDIDKNGSIELSELEYALSQNLGICEKEIKEVFNKMDTNHDGKITYSEFLAGTLENNRAVPEVALKEAFLRFDANGDGRITQADINAILGKSLDGCENSNLMREADYDLNGEISFEEFRRYLQPTADASPIRCAWSPARDTSVFLV